MKFIASAQRTSDGQWLLQHKSSEIGELEVAAATREEAEEMLRGEIRYRLELCPCTGESYRHIDVEIQ